MGDGSHSEFQEPLDSQKRRNQSATGISDWRRRRRKIFDLSGHTDTTSLTPIERRSKLNSHDECSKEKRDFLQSMKGTDFRAGMRAVSRFQEESEKSES